ncbi:hypothetical protein HOY82DRAFT_535198 [Tuber indicum]|nr:hypothetical protein HOY82DRAFT_535198 [Tuber indicum]
MEVPIVPREEELHAYMNSREEHGTKASERLAQYQDKIQSRTTSGYRQPKPGDLVLLRDFQQAKEKGRKLQPRWTTPRILERISTSGVSAHVRQLHEPPGATKRYHFDDLLVYIPRTADFPSTEVIQKPVRPVEYARDAMGDVQGLSELGYVIENGGASVEMAMRLRNVQKILDDVFKVQSCF